MPTWTTCSGCQEVLAQVGCFGKMLPHSLIEACRSDPDRCSDERDSKQRPSPVKLLRSHKVDMRRLRKSTRAIASSWRL